MRRFLLFAAALLLLAACNLSDRRGPPAGPLVVTATPPPTNSQPAQSNPTRTPVSSNNVPPNLAPASPTPGFAPVGVRTPPPSDGGSNPAPSSGPRGSITQPIDGATVTGRMIQIAGTAGGIFENQFTLAIFDAQGNTLVSQGITLDNPNFDNEVPWSAAFTTGNYSGQAEIRAYTASPRDGSEILLGSVHVTIVPG